MTLAASHNLLRRRGTHEHARVTYVELFFDLVFVFAITQLSHHLLGHFSAAGVLETALMLGAVWWLWVYTAWSTNWLDPQATPVRLMLFAMMLGGLVLSMAIPQAFETRGLAFAAAYVAMQLGRTGFMLFALRTHNPRTFRSFQRIFSWLAVAAVFWLAGGIAEGPLRVALWLIALAIDFSGPAASYWTPGLGRSTTADWDIEGGHMAERFGLFIIIALGESILVTGATFGAMAWTPPTIAAFLVAFLGTVAMWWIYYNVGAERGSEAIAQDHDPGRLGRLAYTYFHLLPVAGIILAAVADELVLAHPGGHTDLKTFATAAGGPALFLAGNILFKRALFASKTLSHYAGLGLLAVTAPSALVLSPLAFSALTTAILVMVAVWETRSFNKGKHPVVGV
jgi:low temperature requirement protein LtrA